MMHGQTQIKVVLLVSTSFTLIQDVPGECARLREIVP